MGKTLSKILYAEDDPDIRSVGKMSLEMVGGFDVRACSSGEEAVETAPGFSPDLVLLDVMMPGMDGVTTLERLRQDPRTAAIPVIFMTATAMPSEVARLRALGAADVLLKPFDPMTLHLKLKGIWANLSPADG
jgi:two-component system, OmpR family, response regulator